MGKERNVKKQIIVAMSVCVLAVLLVAGCATGGKGPTDEEQIMNNLLAAKAALLEKDTDAIRALMSDDWYHPEVGGPDEAMDLLQQGIDMGMVDDVEIDLEDAEVTVEGDEATIYPIVVSVPMGSATLEFECVKEDGKWLAIGGNAEGI